MKRKILGVTLAAACTLAAFPALAEDVIVQTGSWSKKQDAAIAAAGGTIVWVHKPTATALVRSSADGLYSRILGTKAFSGAARDVVLNWQPDTKMVEDVVTPGDDTRYAAQWAHTAIDTAGAWAAGCEGAGARIAIIDGGIWDQHDDLDAPGKVDATCSRSFTTGAYNTDVGTFWHGTHVASIAAGEDNLISGVGIAPAAQILHLKALHNGSGSFAGILQAMLYAANPGAVDPTAVGCEGADIANMSLGVSEGVLARDAASHGEGQNFLAFITKVKNYGSQQGVLWVGSAGNDGIDYGQSPNLVVVPNQLGQGLVVAATAPVGWAVPEPTGFDFDTPASYTNFGEGLIDVSAPGGDANCFTPACDGVCQVGITVNLCWVFDLYIAACRGAGASQTSSCFAAGTSMASPVVAGVAALMKGVNPRLTPSQLTTMIQNSANDSGPTGSDQFHGKGFVNASAACAAAQASVH